MVEPKGTLTPRTSQAPPAKRQPRRVPPMRMPSQRMQQQAPPPAPVQRDSPVQPQWQQPQQPQWQQPPWHPQGPADPAMRPPVPQAWVVVLAIGALVGLFLPAIFIQGVAAIDRAQPDKVAAAPLYAGAALAFPALVAAVIATNRRDGWVAVLSGGGVGLLFALLLGGSVQDDYGGLANLWLLGWYLWGGLAALVAYIVTVAVGYSTRSRGALLGAFGVLCGWIGTWSLAALYHLVTLQHQADLAYAAHHRSPPAGLILVVGVLLAAALVRRRRFEA